MSEAAVCKAKMKTIKESLLKIRDYAKECLTVSDLKLENVNVRMKRADELLNQYLEAETKLLGQDENETSKFMEIEDLYYDAIGNFNEVICQRKHSTIADSSKHQSFTTTTTHNLGMFSEACNTKLPKLEIPHFTGNYTDWQSFYELFMEQIDQNARLSDVQRFYYLKSYLSGEAANLVKHMNITSANYKEALDKLRKRYDRKRYAANSFIRRFIEQTTIHQANANNIRKLHDECDEIIRGLKSIGPEAETRDPWLIYLVLTKLDHETRSEWAEYSAKDKFPEFGRLLEFLSNRSDALESYGTAVKPAYSRATRDAKSFTTTIPRCELCKAEHRLYECNNFKELSTADRRKHITDNNRCYNCLNLGHNVYNCRFRGRCQKCYRKHHSLLHEDESTEEEPSINDTSTAFHETSNLHCTRSEAMCILPTAIVKVQCSRGTFHLCRALLDSASEVSFISEKFCKTLDLSRESSSISIKGLGSSYVGKTKGMVNIHLSNDDDTYKTDVNAYIVPYIATMLPKPIINDAVVKFENLKLADPDYYNGGEVDLLLGTDIFFDVLDDGKIQGNQIMAYNTKFGWIQVGKVNSSSSFASTINFNIIMDVDKTLRKFWEVENVPQSSENCEDDICEQEFLRTTSRGPDNKFIVRLPFKIQPDQLGSNYNIALKRLTSMERRFQRDIAFKSLYHDFMTEYESLGHMKLIGEPNRSGYYLPHHGVLKQSTTTRLRVVFDGSSKSTTNLSLNDVLEVGPTVQSSLVEIILRFRQHKFVLSGDIEKMYRMVWIHDDDAKYQQILWRKCPEAPPQAYQLRTITYGTSSASFLSTRCIKEVANRIASKHPQIANIIANDVYVDDLMCGASTIDELINHRNLLLSTLNEFGFNLRKLRSNQEDVLTRSHAENDTSNQKEFSTNVDASKVLGLIWNPHQDKFSFKCELEEFACLTKRGLLSDASKIFDPLGWLSPLVIKIKIMFQKLWLEPITWDDDLPSKTKQDWLILRKSLSNIHQITIPRWLNTTGSIELYGFCDASELAYSAVIYAISGEDNQKRSTILIAKTKVAPIDQLTLPRLELQAAYMLTQLMSFVEKTITLKIQCITLWTDSTLVLNWLSSLPKRWKTFVANRTSFILSLYQRNYWQHISSEDNPADCATRGLSINELTTHSLWWTGPTWLCQTKSQWPTYAMEQPTNIKSFEERVQVNSYVIVANEFFDQLVMQHSSFYRMSYNLAIIIKCAKYLITTFRDKTRLCHTRAQVNEILKPTPENIRAAASRILLYEQQRMFTEEYTLLTEGKPLPRNSKLKTFNPFIHTDKLIRVGGRLSNSNFDFNLKHPIIIPNNSLICTPLVRDYHQLYNHAGPGLCLSLLRRKYWILRCKNVIRAVIHKCIKCFRANPQRERQQMGDLPACRVQYEHAFANTGIDYCGPFEVKTTNRRGQPITKVYVCLFVCLSTKAVHIEVVTSLSTEGFLSALQRFVSRRGLCKNIYSDNGINFVGANNHLKELYKFIKGSNNQIYSYLLRWEITWHFIPPGAPHMGGIWEASVKLLKNNMRRITNGHTLSFEEFFTLVTRIEAAINSRPLYVEQENDMELITPAHFIIGRALLDVPEVEHIYVAKSKYSRWNIVKHMYAHFCRRWHRDYITTLQKRTKWYQKSQNVKIGDVVLVVDDNASSCYWPLAQVISVHPGRDDLVRVVTIKVASSNNVLQRPISKICKLPIDQEDAQ